MKKQIYKIVLTGGPCAGKTTLISKLNQIFSNKGYRVFTINETATELINNGIRPFGNCLSLLDFQDFVFSTQFFKEENYLKAANLVSEDKVLIICDRGILDNKSYITDNQFAEILKRYNKKEINIRDNYNAVIHLVTAADGAEEAYNLDNAARTETIEQAIQLDRNTLNSWIGHPKLIKIDNSTSFEEKMKRAINSICNILGEPIPEKEYKYLVELPDENFLSKLKHVEITQTYLMKKNNVERKIRQRGLPDDYVYYYIEKKLLPNKEIIKTEKIIDIDEYLTLQKEINFTFKPIVKTRYFIFNNNEYFTLDKFSFDNKKALLEVSINDNSKIYLPENISIIKDVSNNENYKNYNIALNYSI